MFGLTNFCIGQSSSIAISIIDTFNVNFDNKYELSSVNIIPTSEYIYVGERKLNSDDYFIDLKSNILSLADTLSYSIFDTIYVNYKSNSLSLKKNYFNRKLIVRYNNQYQDSIGVVVSRQVDLSTSGILGKDLVSSGTLLRGISLGTNKDLSVNSGLRLQLSGKISNEIEIIAALTDENTPIQPEGNTERLDELDKVFIEIKHKNASGIFGDYNYSTSIGEFGKIERKLQGVLGNVNILNYGGSISFASSRGKFNSMQFQGIDAVQGPYRLYGVDNENDIIVIAGSEKVFLNGNPLKRGENNDYTIEYSTGEITFTPKIIITNLSRITIDFEYTNRQYERNLIGANAYANFFNNKLKIKINAMQEGDNKNNPIDLSLSDSDKQILSTSGDNPFLASVSGAIQLSDDSLGVYSVSDSLINGTTTEVYTYNPGSPSARYNVTFSFVGEQNGDYKRESIGKYVFVGIGLGAYLPIRLIPLPETNQLGNVLIEYTPIKEISLNLELAASSFDRNSFSDFDDDDNNGFARSIRLNVDPLELKLFNSHLGKIGGSFKERVKDARFRSIDRINEIEFDRDYNTSNSINAEETLREFKLDYEPLENIQIFNQYGLLKRGVSFSSERYLSKALIENYSNLNIKFSNDYVNTNSIIQNSNWLKQDGEISYNIWKIQPGFEFRSEEKKEKMDSQDSLLSSSFKFDEYSPFLLFNISKGLSFTSKYSFTQEFAADNGDFSEESKSYSQTYSLLYRDLKELNSTLDFSFRKKKYSQLFSEKGFVDNESIQIRSQNQIKLFDRLIDGSIYYQTSSERSAKLERVFVRVPQGTGNYSYQGDLNGNGLAEESEFVPDPYEGDFIQTTLPTDELFPVIDLKLNTRWKISFDKYITKSSFFNDILKTMNSETIYRLEENSRVADAEKIYLLNFNYFLNDSTTIRGFNYFQQDLYIFKNKRDLSFRFRFTERRSLSQFSAGLESSYSKLRSLKIKFRMVEEINNETEFINETENVNAPLNTNRSRLANSNKLISDFSYRPYSNIEFGFLFSVGQIEDKFPMQPTILDENKLAIRLTLSILNKGRLRVEAERTELLTNTRNNIIPFEITNGNLIGKNYIWRANFDYRFSSNLQTNVNYSARMQGKGRVINTFTAEARAYF